MAKLKNDKIKANPKLFQYLYKPRFSIFALYAFGKTFVIKYTDQKKI